VEGPPDVRVSDIVRALVLEQEPSTRPSQLLADYDGVVYFERIDTETAPSLRP